MRCKRARLCAIKKYFLSSWVMMSYYFCEDIRIEYRNRYFFNIAEKCSLSSSLFFLLSLKPILHIYIYNSIDSSEKESRQNIFLSSSTAFRGHTSPTGPLSPFTPFPRGIFLIPLALPAHLPSSSFLQRHSSPCLFHSASTTGSSGLTPLLNGSNLGEGCR